MNEIEKKVSALWPKWRQVSLIRCSKNAPELIFHCFNHGKTLSAQPLAERHDLCALFGPAEETRTTPLAPQPWLSLVKVLPHYKSSMRPARSSAASMDFWASRPLGVYG